ncbi:hypothetical protein ES703_99175 [subsurface metagenome]
MSNFIDLIAGFTIAKTVVSSLALDGYSALLPMSSGTSDADVTTPDGRLSSFRCTDNLNWRNIDYMVSV